MKHESNQTSTLIDALAVEFWSCNGPLPEVTKHSDRATSGVPDVSICTQGATVWLEVKLSETRGTLRTKTKLNQTLKALRMARATGGKVLFVCYLRKPCVVMVASPAWVLTTCHARHAAAHLRAKDDIWMREYPDWNSIHIAREIGNAIVGSR